MNILYALGVAAITALVALSGFNAHPVEQNVGATIPTAVALWESSLATAITSSATSMTLTSAVDKAGTTFASSTYAFVIDSGTSQEEMVIANCTGTACTGMTRGISPITGTSTVASLQFAHRRGASVKITDGPQLLILSRILNGQETVPNPLVYDSSVSTTTLSTNDNNIATVGYANYLTIAGSPDATTVLKGISKMSVAPAVASSPIAVGDNDPRVPTQGENDALAGTSGTPSSTNKYVTQEDPLMGSPTGTVTPFAGFSAPTGWLLADGTAVSRTTYSSLFSVINPEVGTTTITIATPAVATSTAHGLVLDDKIYFTTTGALPTGVATGTIYYVISAGLATNQFEFSTSKGGSAVNTSGSQSGVHTIWRSPYGLGDGSTTFNLPSMKGNVAVGRNSAETEFNAVGETGGEKTHVLTEAELAAHTHTTGYGSGGGTFISNGGSSAGTPQTTSSAGSNTAHNNLQPYVALNYIIKY